MSLDHLAARVEGGDPLTDADIEALESTSDIIELGMLATAVRRRLHGSTVTYVRVVDLKLPRDGWPDALPPQAGEVRIFQTPDTLDGAIEVAEAARELVGETPLTAFCLFELSKLPEGLPVVLSALKGAGLERIAQAPIEKLRAPEDSLEALTDAGLRLARLTINDTPDRRWTELCRQVAAHQTRLGSLRTFAPLARAIAPGQPTTGYEDVRRIAIARLVAGNIDSIQVDWALYGPKLSQVALTFGADDIDSVSADDDDSQGRRRSPVEEIHRNIRAAGYQPAERDARFAERG